MIKTRIAKVDGQYLDREVLAEAGKILKAGGVAVPLMGKGYWIWGGGF